MDTCELGDTAPNSETHVKGFLLGGLISEAPVRVVPTCCYSWPQHVLPAVFVVQLGGGSGAAGARGESAWAGDGARRPPCAVLVAWQPLSC